MDLKKNGIVIQDMDRVIIKVGFNQFVGMMMMIRSRLRDFELLFRLQSFFGLHVMLV